MFSRPFGTKSFRVGPNGGVFDVECKASTQGAQSRVYIGEWLEKDVSVPPVASVLKRSVPKNQEQRAAAEFEIALLRELRHPHVVQYIADGKEVRSGEENLYLVLEYCRGGTVLELANQMRLNRRPLTRRGILQLCRQMCSAVDFLHAHKPPIAHRDVKLENFCLMSKDPDSRIVLCDFGSASCSPELHCTPENRLQVQEMVERTTTPAYRAPELVDLYQGWPISEKVDVWALGCCCFALAYGEHAYENTSFEADSTNGALSGRVPFPMDREPDASFEALLQWMLTREPSLRPAVGDVFDLVVEMHGSPPEVTALQRGTGYGARPMERNAAQTSGCAFEDTVKKDSFFGISAPGFVSLPEPLAVPTPNRPPPPLATPNRVPPPLAKPTRHPPPRHPPPLSRPTVPARAAPALPRTDVLDQLVSPATGSLQGWTHYAVPEPSAAEPVRLAPMQTAPPFTQTQKKSAPSRPPPPRASKS